MEAAIETHGLGFTLAGKPILADVDLQVPRGEVFGVLGPNGAGKTTAVRLLNGLLRPSSGSARVLGLDPAHEGDAVRQRTGVLTESPALYERLSARANLEFFATLHGLPPAAALRALDRLGLAGRANEPAGSFSKGMQQRLAIARAILHEPELLFLDEPTAALDPESAERVNALLNDYRAAGRTVFLATHHLLEAERQCDRFAFFARGRLIACGTRAELEARADAPLQVVLTYAGAEEELVTVPALDAIPQVVAAAVAAGKRIMRVEPRVPSLQELYFRLVGRAEA